MNDAESNFQSQCLELKKELSMKNEQFENILNEKDKQIKEALENLILINTEIEKVKSDNEKIIHEQSNKINELKENINESLLMKVELEDRLAKSEKSYRDLFTVYTQEKEKLSNSLSEKSLECDTLILIKQVRVKNKYVLLDDKYFIKCKLYSIPS